MHATYPVTLVKRFRDIDGNWSMWARNRQLPMPPREDVRIQVSKWHDPRAVTHIWISADEHVFVEIEDDDWFGEADQFNEEEPWEEQRAYQLRGWHLVGDHDSVGLRLYRQRLTDDGNWVDVEDPTERREND